MSRNNTLKSVALMLSPLLLFAVLAPLYGWLNGELIVDIFGCGCPQINEQGEIIHPSFNANDFTAIFWCVITLCVTAISIFIAIKKIPRQKMWLRAVYVAGIVAVSLLISYCLYQAMMWN